jgi:phosphatidylserine decarboxylase
MKKFTWPDPPSPTAYPVARAGYPFIFCTAFVTAVFALLGLTTLTMIGLVLAGFITFFFRDPDRLVPNREAAVVSPADGKVLSVRKIQDNPFGDEACLKISIFMSIVSVHVNRIPYDGVIKNIDYYPGKFFSANMDKASKQNEHNAVELETDGGKKIVFVQIAGFIARRIICRIQEGDIVSRGQRFGMICFGSRLDVYLPIDTDPSVSAGEYVNAGNSILGYLK